MTHLPNSTNPRADAYHERTALDFMCPGLFQSLWVMGHMIGIDIRPDETLPAFAKRLITELDELCELYGIYDDQLSHTGA